MRYGHGSAAFDLSDAQPIDRLDDILDVAAGVLEDHGPDHGNTRLERLARWVIYNVGEVPSLERCAAIARDHKATAWTTVDNGMVFVVAETRGMTSIDARYFASQILRAAARAEE